MIARYRNPAEPRYRCVASAVWNSRHWQPIRCTQPLAIRTRNNQIGFSAWYPVTSWTGPGQALRRGVRDQQMAQRAM